MKLILLLALLTVSECDSSTVGALQGGNVTLSCKYDFKYYGVSSMCWGRGDIPSSGCNKKLISTDGHKVVEGSRVSSRYQLLGRLEDGDVSLTILNVSQTDAGRYGCRVEISGWFNDDKHHFDLVVEKAPQTTTSTTAPHRETSTASTAGTGQVTSTERLLASSSSSVTAEESSSSVNVVLVCVLFGLVALVTAGIALIITVSRRRRLNKIPQQQVSSSVQFSSTLSTLQLHSRGEVVENIYQIDGGGDEGDEYEYCP